MEKKRVLIIDDEDDFREMVRINLMKLQRYDVLDIANAKDLLSHLQAFRPDVILLDLVMPGIGGLEICEMLNSDPLGSKTPLIILSALSKDSDKYQAFRRGVVDYLEKPMSIEAIVDAIEKALRYKDTYGGQ